MVRPSSLEQVTAVLRAEALGLGLTLAELRARYPGQVRRISLLQALAYLEEVGLVRRVGPRVRWVGPLQEGARPLGVDLRRLERDLALSPQERVARMTRLSAALARPRATRGGP